MNGENTRAPRRVLLLGGSSAVSLAYLRAESWQAGDEIVAQYCHHAEALEAMRETVAPAKLTLCAADFSSVTSTEAFAQKLLDDGFVPTHILHAPAVRLKNERFHEISWEWADEQLRVSCQSLLTVLHALLRPMAKAKTGKIVLVLSSVTKNLPPKFMASYVMAKYALLGLGRALAAEYAPKHIQVNMVSPSMMETPFVQDIYEGVVAQSAAANPQKRNARPEDVANVLRFLFSEANTFTTGANIPVTGGEAF